MLSLVVDSWFFLGAQMGCLMMWVRNCVVFFFLRRVVPFDKWFEMKLWLWLLLFHKRLKVKVAVHIVAVERLVIELVVLAGVLSAMYMRGIVTTVLIVSDHVVVEVLWCAMIDLCNAWSVWVLLDGPWVHRELRICLNSAMLNNCWCDSVVLDNGWMLNSCSLYISDNLLILSVQLESLVVNILVLDTMLCLCLYFMEELVVLAFNRVLQPLAIMIVNVVLVAITLERVHNGVVAVVSLRCRNIDIKASVTSPVWIMLGAFIDFGFFLTREPLCSPVVIVSRRVSITVLSDVFVLGQGRVKHWSDFNISLMAVMVLEWCLIAMDHFFVGSLTERTFMVLSTVLVSPKKLFIARNSGHSTDGLSDFPNLID